MTNSNDIKRATLRTLYGPQWAAKVDKMSDAQMLAIYLKFQSKGIIK